MVVAHIFEQYGSTNRGLTRREVPASTKEWYRLQESKNSTLSVENTLSQQLGAIPPATKPKRKRCKASKFLSSLAADLDVVTDWMFFFHTCKFFLLGYTKCVVIVVHRIWIQQSNIPAQDFAAFIVSSLFRF